MAGPGSSHNCSCQLDSLLAFGELGLGLPLIVLSGKFTQHLLHTLANAASYQMSRCSHCMNRSAFAMENQDGNLAR